MRFCAPTGLEVYLLPDGILLYARTFPKRDLSLRIITQNRFNHLLATIYQQGETYLSIEVDKNLFVATLPPSFCDCELFFAHDLLFIKSRKQLAIYSPFGEKLWLENATEFSLTDDGFQVEIPLLDSKNRRMESVWEVKDDKVHCVSRKLLAGVHEGAQEESIQEELLAYAFFESVRFGGDIRPFLSEEMQEKQEQIAQFLGEFCEVSPTANPNICALVYPCGEQIFSVRFYTVHIKNGKIDDITI